MWSLGFIVVYNREATILFIKYRREEPVKDIVRHYEFNSNLAPIQVPYLGKEMNGP